MASHSSVINGLLAKAGNGTQYGFATGHPNVAPAVEANPHVVGPSSLASPIGPKAPKVDVPQEVKAVVQAPAKVAGAPPAATAPSPSPKSSGATASPAAAPPPAPKATVAKGKREESLAPVKATPAQKSPPVVVYDPWVKGPDAEVDPWTCDKVRASSKPVRLVHCECQLPVLPNGFYDHRAPAAISDWRLSDWPDLQDVGVFPAGMTEFSVVLGDYLVLVVALSPDAPPVSLLKTGHLLTVRQFASAMAAMLRKVSTRQRSAKTWTDHFHAGCTDFLMEDFPGGRLHVTLHCGKYPTSAYPSLDMVDVWVRTPGSFLPWLSLAGLDSGEFDLDWENEVKAWQPVSYPVEGVLGWAATEILTSIAWCHGPLNAVTAVPCLLGPGTVAGPAEASFSLQEVSNPKAAQMPGVVVRSFCMRDAGHRFALLNSARNIQGVLGPVYDLWPGLMATNGVDVTLHCTGEIASHSRKSHLRVFDIEAVSSATLDGAVSDIA